MLTYVSTTGGPPARPWKGSTTNCVYATHKHEKVNLWLARHPRFHIHFTPTHSSRLNQVETWFGIITRHAIRRGMKTSAKQEAEKSKGPTPEGCQHPAIALTSLTISSTCGRHWSSKGAL